LLEQIDSAIFANVVSRMEFIDLIFRKLVTYGAIQLYENKQIDRTNKNLNNMLKSIRDQNTSERSLGKSYKLDEAKLKKLKRELMLTAGEKSWPQFCSEFTDQILKNEWQILEEEMGLNFIEIMEGATNAYFKTPISWMDMVEIMGQHGMRATDAMIANLFIGSEIPLLITTDNDFIDCFSQQFENKNKAVYIL